MSTPQEFRAMRERYDQLRAAVEALADEWERREFFSGAFYPEATAYDDGQRVRSEADADDLRGLLEST